MHAQEPRSPASLNLPILSRDMATHFIWTLWQRSGMRRLFVLQDLPRQTYTLDPTLYEIAWFNILSKLQRIRPLQYLRYRRIYVYSTPRFGIHSNGYLKASIFRLGVLPICQNKQDNDQKGKVHIQNRPKLSLQLTSQNTYISPMKPEQAFVADG